MLNLLAITLVMLVLMILFTLFLLKDEFMGHDEDCDIEEYKIPTIDPFGSDNMTEDGLIKGEGYGLRLRSVDPKGKGIINATYDVVSLDEEEDD